MNRVEIAFCDKNIPNDPGFVLELSNNMKYDQMVEAVSERVGIDKHRIQIYKCQRYGFSSCCELRDIICMLSKSHCRLKVNSESESGCAGNRSCLYFEN